MSERKKEDVNHRALTADFEGVEALDEMEDHIAKRNSHIQGESNV